MSVTVKFSCDGCNASVEGSRSLRNEFVSFSGQSHGFGQYHEDPASRVCPAAWVAFDPCTGCCYCPTCWKSIVGDTADMSDPFDSPAIAAE